MELLEAKEIAKGFYFSAGYSRGNAVTIFHSTSEKEFKLEEHHYHSEDYEYYYLLNGWIEVLVEGEIIKVNEHKCLEVAPREKHKVVANSEDFEYIVVRTNNIPGEKVVLE